MNSGITVGKKLTLIGGFLLGLTLVLGLCTLTGLNSLVGIAHSLSVDSFAGVSACGKMESNLIEMHGDMWRHVASTNPNGTAEMERDIQTLKEEVNKDLQEVASAVLTDEEREINRKIQPALERYYQAWETVVPLSRAGKNDLAYNQFLAEVSPAFTVVKETVRAELNSTGKPATGMPPRPRPLVREQPG